MSGDRVHIGVDVGGTKILGGAVASDGRILRRHRVDTPSRDAAPEAATDAIARLVRELAEGYDVAAVGVGAAGFVNAERSMVMFAPHLPWRQYPLEKVLEDELGFAVVIENDANAAIWAEFRYGVAADAHEAIGVTIGTGVGGAAIVAGHLQRGHNGMAGEFGHVRVVPDGHPCHCGLRGCLEQYASGSALTRFGQELVAKGEGGRLSELAGGDPEKLTGPMISQAAQEGDAAARGVFLTLGDWLGAGLASLVSAFDPEIVVVGGGLVEVSDLFIGRTREAFAEHVPGRGYRRLPEIVPAELGQDAGFLGAADLAASGG